MPWVPRGKIQPSAQCRQPPDAAWPENQGASVHRQACTLAGGRTRKDRAPECLQGFSAPRPVCEKGSSVSAKMVEKSTTPEFRRILYRMIERSKLTKHQRTVLRTIISCGHTEISFSIGTLADRAGCTTRTARTAVSLLAKHGVLVKIKDESAGCMPRVYKFAPQAICTMIDALNDAGTIDAIPGNSDLLAEILPRKFPGIKGERDSTSTVVQFPKRGVFAKVGASHD